MAELNGVPVTPDELQVLALVNYGHFTSMRVEDQHVRGLSHHLERLVRDCRVLFSTDLDREQIREFIRHATSGREGSFVVRVTVFDPDLDLGRPGASAAPGVLVTTRSTGDLPMPPMRVQSTTYVRDMPRLKHIGLFGALWHRREAQLNGFDDAVFVDDDGFVTEGATWNIGFFDGHQVVWPNAEVLPGVTMRLLQQVHERTSLAPVSVADLPRMEAAFATNTTVGVRAISAINDFEFPPAHPILETLRKEYEEIPAEALWPTLAPAEPQP
jgi:branched-subunit amino acid aminotransferase/4-amino-4-deoxychorismate lyase